MRIDHFFTIGKRHEDVGTPCEDYAMSGELYTKNHKFAVISDGCSGAKSKTDIGSRLWCLAFERVLNTLPQNKILIDFDFCDLLLNEYQEKRICTNIYDEYASVVGLLATEDYAQIFIMGDGGYGLQLNNGNYLLTEVQWEDNKPFYPIYKTYDHYNYELVSSNFKGSKNTPVKIIEREFAQSNKALNNLSFSPFNNTNYNLIREDISYHSFESFEDGYCKTFNIKENNISGISIFSDGLWSVNNKLLSQTIKDVYISPNDNVKNFVKEEMLRTISVWKKKEIMPIDDFSIAHAVWNK